MDLKNYDIGKFIDKTVSQLLHYLFPKKGEIEGSLAAKPWMKKVRTLCLCAIALTFFLLIYLIIDSALAPLQFLLGIIFLIMVLGCFLAIGISALFKRNGSVFYLYLLKGCVWVFCGSLLFAAVGWLMSRPNPQLIENRILREAEQQRREKVREANRESFNDLWEDHRLLKNNTSESTTLKQSEIETSKANVSTQPENTLDSELFYMKKQLEKNSEHIEQLQKTLAQETEKTKSLENKLKDKSLNPSKETVRPNKSEDPKTKNRTVSEPFFTARSPAEKWADDAVIVKERELKQKKIKEQELLKEDMLKERLERLSYAASRKKYEDAHPNGPEYSVTCLWRFTDEEIAELEQELELEAVTKENSNLQKQREELLNSYENHKIGIPDNIEKLQKIFRKIAFFEEQLQAFEPSAGSLQEEQLETPSEFEKEWSKLQLWLEQKKKENFSSSDDFILIQESTTSKKVIFIENEELDQKIKEIKAKNTSLQQENAVREMAEKESQKIISGLYKAIHEASEKSREIQRKLDRLIEKTANSQDKIGFKSVSEVIDMIVEVEDGEDIFVEDQGTAVLLREREKEKNVKTTNKSKKQYFLVKDEKGELVLVQELQEGKK